MGTKAIEPGDTVLLVASEDETKYWAKIKNTRVQLGRSKSVAESDGRSRDADAGDRGPLHTIHDNEEIWAHNPHSTKTASVDMDRNGFIFDRSPRSVIGSVLTSDENEAAPSSDAYVHEHGTSVDVNAETESVSFEAPDRADFIVINVDDATGAYHVEVQFEDGDGNVVTQRDDDNNSDYSGSSTADVLVRTAVASPYCTVRIVDDSGAGNTLDYSIYAR